MGNTPKNTPPSTAWKPGCPSPNPAGRPKGSGTSEVIEFARKLTLKALKRLEKLVDDETTDERVLVRIASIAAETARLPREDGAAAPQVIRFEFVSDWTAPVGGDDSAVVTTPATEGHA